MRHYDAAEARCAQLDGRMQTTSRVGADEIGHDQMRSKSKAAWETAARCATLIEEADDPREREYYSRLRDAWITLAKRCEFFSISDVTESEKF
jgi:hypothetical protein